ncbi:HET domain-containing protein [Candidatus Bathyarchaeota archaeon]|nr:HET domain-containing protein [Candidatus Bathyarchaeota archaeon]
MPFRFAPLSRTISGQRNPWRSIGSLVLEDDPRKVHASVPGGQASHVPADPNAPASFALIRRWLQTCLDTHEACRLATSSSSHPLPRRVIFVGDDSNAGVRLVETDTLVQGNTAARSSYLALSHCWGTVTHLTTTSETLSARKTNIAWASLPATFQDAVLITRGLGFEYVWIDSLCIVQNDAQDWVNESAKMASIYEGATLVLSATSSAGSSGGCLFPRDPYLEVQGTSHDGEPFSFFGRTKRDHQIFNVGSASQILEHVWEWDSEVYLHYPLYTRAWCFQERLLATRVLHFTRGEMVFDCLTSISCECGRLSGYTGDPLRRPRQVAKLGGPVGTKFPGWQTYRYVPLDS